MDITALFYPCLYVNSAFSSCPFSSPLLQTCPCTAETLDWKLSNISLGLRGPGLFNLQHEQFGSTKKRKDHLQTLILLFLPKHSFFCSFRNTLQVPSWKVLFKDVTSSYSFLAPVLRPMEANDRSTCCNRQ